MQFYNNNCIRPQPFAVVHLCDTSSSYTKNSCVRYICHQNELRIVSDSFLTHSIKAAYLSQSINHFLHICSTVSCTSTVLVYLYLYTYMLYLFTYISYISSLYKYKYISYLYTYICYTYILILYSTCILVQYTAV